MWAWFRKRLPVIISRDRLRVLVSHQCDNQDFVPLDMVYRLVPSHRWLIGKTPIFPRWMKDCNKRVAFAKAKMLKYCVGECIVSTDDPLIDHCLLIVCMEDEHIRLYDPGDNVLKNPKYYNVKRIWL